MLNIIQNRKIYFVFSGLLVLGSILSMTVYGLNFGIDFTGGSLVEIEFASERQPNDAVREKLQSLDLGEINIQRAGDKGLILRLRDLDEPTHQSVLDVLRKEFGDVEEKRFESVGPVIGEELKRRSFWAIGWVMVMIVVYIAFVFRKVSGPVASWKFGLTAIIALVHDILIPLGIFSILGRFLGVEIGLLFVTAILTILGFSVHDTIVVFDRVRENLRRFSGENFEQLVNKSVNDTLSRSINTSLTTLLVLGAIYFLGGETIKYFSLALIIGIVSGTYSSIFVASPTLVLWEKKRGRK